MAKQQLNVQGITLRYTTRQNTVVEARLSSEPRTIRLGISAERCLIRSLIYGPTPVCYGYLTRIVYKRVNDACIHDLDCLDTVRICSFGNETGKDRKT